MTMTSVLDGFLFTMKADGHSPAMVDLYRIMLTILVVFIQNREVSDIAPNYLTRRCRYFIR
jgi:hypothetical protein